MLQGTLDNFALDEVLQLLSSTSKTGKLELNGDRGTGSVALDHGQLVEAHVSSSSGGSTNGASIDDVLFELLRFQDGEFNFTTTDHEEGDLKVDTGKALADAGGRLADWRSVQAVVPSLRHVVTPSTDLPADEITINRDEWAALNVIGRGSPASRFCDETGLGEVEGSSRLRSLFERGLVTISAPPQRERTTEQPTTPADARRPTGPGARPDTRPRTGPTPAPAPSRPILSDTPPVPATTPSGAVDDAPRGYQPSPAADDPTTLAHQRHPSSPDRTAAATRQVPGRPPGNGGTPVVPSRYEEWPRRRPPMPAPPTAEQLAEATAHSGPAPALRPVPEDAASDEPLPPAAAEDDYRDDYDEPGPEDDDPYEQDQPESQASEPSRPGRLRRYLRSGH